MAAEAKISTITVQEAIEAFKATYPTEIRKQKLPKRFKNDLKNGSKEARAAARIRVAAKLYAYYFLKVVQTHNKTYWQEGEAIPAEVALIGTKHFLPTPEDKETLHISRINTGIVMIHGIGPIVIDLGGINGATVSTKMKTKEATQQAPTQTLKFNPHKSIVKMFPVSVVEKITLETDTPNDISILKSSFPTFPDVPELTEMQCINKILSFLKQVNDFIAKQPSLAGANAKLKESVKTISNATTTSWSTKKRNWAATTDSEASEVDGWGTTEWKNDEEEESTNTTAAKPTAAAEGSASANRSRFLPPAPPSRKNREELEELKVLPKDNDSTEQVRRCAIM